MTRVLLTGATGLVGHAVLKELVSARTPVLLLLRDPAALTGTLHDQPQIEVLQYDLEDIAPEVLQQIGRFAPETVIHAGWLGVENTNRDHAPFVAGNLRSCLQLFEAASSTCRQWIGFGSQAEYSTGLPSPIHEEMPTLPTGNYGIAKLAACHMLNALCSTRNIAFTWLRLFPCYGREMRSSYIIPYLIERMIAGDIPEVRTPGAEWDYLHVRDAAQAVLRIIGHPKPNGIFNLGHGKSVSVREIVLTLADLLQFKRTDELRALMQKNPAPASKRIADTTKFRRTFDWTPRIGLREGLAHSLPGAEE